MYWFKHYSDSASGRFVNHLIEKFGLNGYAWHYLLIELCSEKWDGHSEPIFTFHERVVRQKLRTTRTKVEQFLGFCQTKGQLSFDFSEKEFQIEMPKLAEIKSSRTVVKNSKAPIKRKNKNRKEKEKNNTVAKAPDGFVQEVISGMNKILGSKYRYGAATEKLVLGLKKQGHEISSILSVVRYKKSDWDNDKMRRHLKPVTLFGNKFSMYLEEALEFEDRKEDINKRFQELISFD